MTADATDVLRAYEALWAEIAGFAPDIVRYTMMRRLEDWLFQSTTLLAAGALMLAGYVFLGKRYLFSIPFRGIVPAAVAYLGGLFFGL